MLVEGLWKFETFYILYFFWLFSACSVFIIPPKHAKVCEWSCGSGPFFFQLGRLGSCNRGNWFGPLKPNLQFWAYKKMWIGMDFCSCPKSTWIDHFFILFFEKLFFFFSFSFFGHGKWFSKIMIDANLIALLYDLGLGFHFCFP